jgi:hypothetical protein
LIKITQSGDIYQIEAYVTDFAGSMGYCEFKIPFYIEGQYVKTAMMEQGSKNHEKAEQIERETSVSIPLTSKMLKNKKADLSFFREAILTRYERIIESDQGKAKLVLIGRADKVMRRGSILVVADDKNSGRPQVHDSLTKPYDDQLLQVLTYLHSNFYLGQQFGGWGQIPHTKKMYQVNILDRRTSEVYKTYEDYVSEEHEEWLADYTDRFALKCLQWAELEHHFKRDKCKACSYLDSCTNALK